MDEFAGPLLLVAIRGLRRLQPRQVAQPDAGQDPRDRRGWHSERLRDLGARHAQPPLEGFGVTLVGMEATGVYWKPVFSVLERRFECWLINAEHLHNVPARKSDVIDSRWCCELLELGLVRPSFVPRRRSGVCAT